MFDAQHQPRLLQRSRGTASVVLGPRGLIDLAQSGSAKAMLPRVPSGLPGIPATEIVFLNTSGGLASGDRLSYAVTLRPNCRALATTQTAERAYRAEDAPAVAEVRMQVERNGWLDWLPQETILFDGAKLERNTLIDLAPGAGCLLLDMIVLGRLAMGEQVARLHLRDRRTVWQNGRIVHHDSLALDDVAMARRGGAAVLNGARAMATMTLVAPHAGDLLDPARDAMIEPGVTGAASAPPGRLTIRLLANDNWPLRRQVNRLLTALRPDPLPRIWQV